MYVFGSGSFGASLTSHIPAIWKPSLKPDMAIKIVFLQKYIL